MVNLRPIEPANPAAPYIGGKRILSKKVIQRINATPHQVYAEPFVGMGGVFLRRDLAPKMEVINDISGEVANLFRILQRHYPQFMETLRFQVTSRREFDRLSRTDPSTLTDLERAARFLYLQRLAFGGKVRGQNFGISMQGGRFNLMKLGPQLEEIHERMAGVVIENLPWRRFIERYDRPSALFYLDPPYWGSEDDYGKTVFDRAEFVEMAQVLASLKGRFILSLNAVQGVYETFADFSIEEVDCTYSVAGGGHGKAVKEVIISG
ncbi:DNA adenine methylase [Rhizobium laguerreae]|uniref:DNA adenine methylase n=1 Tax=Rhizobium laguerreae TaxID=1076926 RepID=UPI001C906BCC|nr:DNA adenine methylase [Rhizobium laguerreae]MBY3342740.1 DNA adenine methylase [Rhizobium laguerreae]MBY3349775.1 DNA adenine methylase [Rhizobium laguerreae]MBY3370878.1 DNA adenine methylase [Rhizobium laguerreae]MBY3426118.1 DNA adenine methylase [Rhizobium laguerreae]MBY3434330.1 DNA adenine methylase [Rhizobium laguerreae]